jgi:spore coat polysaccharide biosynthesis protein SpsF
MSDTPRRTVVIVQARTGSSRLPRKVLMPLEGRSVLSHVLARCHAIDGVDEVCCATTIDADDDPVADEAERCGAVVFRGSEKDVLERYHLAAKACKADIVMRVTSDCPLIDPQIAANVLALRAEKNADYAANNMPQDGSPRGWPHGLDCEAFTAQSLADAAEKAEDPYEHEHVTPWIRNNPDLLRVNLDGPGGHTHRWTLDYPEDMDFFRALFAHLPPMPPWPNMDTVLEVLERHPEISEINKMRRDQAS